MPKKVKYISIFILILVIVSCKNDKKNNALKSNTESELKTDSLNGYNEIANSDKRETFTVSEYNTDNPEIENVKRPEKTIIRNLAVDTTKVFGIWTQDPNGPHADFWLTEKSFYVVDYDGDGNMPYILDENEITIFYNDFIQKGIITSIKNDKLKIKWSDFDKETEYVKFETVEKENDKKPFVIAVNTESFFLNSFNLSKPFSVKEMIQILGKPDKLDKNIDDIEETGFPDYSIEYGSNIIWASYGHISNVYVKEMDMKINDIKLGDNRNKIDNKFNINTESKKYIQLVNPREESILIKFDKNDIITELDYGKLIL